MDDIFISYSRKDKAFATRLHEALQSRQRQAWVDLEDIPPTAEWRAQIKAGIEGARAFVFVLSPDSMASPECLKEVDHAAASHKRLIPVVCREVDPQAAPEALSKLNWIFLMEQDDFEKGLDTLLTAVDTDLEWVDAHTNLLEKATEWDRKARDQSLLLRGGELRESEGWQLKSADKEPKPTELMASFIVSSRQDETRRQRRTGIFLTSGLIIALVLAGLAWYQRGVAKHQARVALSRQLAAQADKLSDRQLDLALLLGVEAFQVEPNLESSRSLLTALQSNPKISRFLDHKDVYSVAFSPDGKTLASGSQDSTIRLWNVETGRSRGGPLTGQQGWVTSVAFSPDGKTLASSSGDRTIRLWDVETGDPKGAPLTEHKGGVSSVAFSPDGKTLASASWDITIMLWDAATGQPRGAPLTGHNNPVISVAFSPDGKTLASASMRVLNIEGPGIVFWDLETGQPRDNPLPEYQGDVYSVAFSPDVKTLASAIKDKTIMLWDLEAGRPQRAPLTGHKGDVISMAFSPDGKTLASGSRTIILWDVATGQPRGEPLTGHQGSVKGVAFSPDGKILASGSSDEPIRLWDVDTDKPLGLLLTGHYEGVTSLVFSPDGKLLASVSRNDGTIRLWDMETGQPRGKPLYDLDKFVDGVAFSQDGKTLVSLSTDKIRLWDVDTGKRRGELLRGLRGELGVLSPDGKTLVSGSDDRTIRLWDIDAQSWIKRACTIANRNLTHEEWQKYLGDLPYRRTCPDLPFPEDRQPNSGK